MRTEAPSPLTADEHRELGREIKATAARLQELQKLVDSVYGPNNQSSFSFRRTVESLERLQNDLQAQAAADLPGFLVDGFYV